MNVFSIAGIQFHVVAGRSNVAEMERQLASVVARFPWVQMVVFSELAAFGPDTKHVDSADAELETSFQELAARYGVWLIPGSHFVKTGTAVCNRAIVIDPTGDIVGRYHKQFPFLPYEQDVEPGSDFLVFDVPDGVRQRRMEYDFRTHGDQRS